MPHPNYPKPSLFEIVLHGMLYGLGSAGAICFALIAYLESQI